jgi:hypothetical protein
MNLKKQRTWSVAIVGIVIFLALGSSDSGSSGRNSSTPTTADQPTASNSEAEPEALDPQLTWQYDESSDEMGRGKIRTAFVSSLNEVDFDFPYQGAQRAQLVLRRHPKYGRNVILQVEKGQILTGIDGCDVQVRFDGGKARTYRGMGAADHSTTSVFLNNFDRFIAAAKKAKKVYIEAPFYQEGERVFEFNVKDLKF